MAQSNSIYSFDFNNGLQGWQNPDGYYGWHWQYGSTPTFGTGPWRDAGPGFGHYIYMESSEGDGPNRPEDPDSYFVSPEIEWERYVVVFSYHMYGSTMGTLYFEVSQDDGNTWETVWSKSGQVQSSDFHSFRRVTVPLFGYAGSNLILRFRGEANVLGDRGDMAIDNVFIQLPQLFLNVERGFLEGGPSSEITISIPVSLNEDLLISVTSEPFVRIPETVTIPAGQTSANFSLSILDDADTQGDRAATITASADGFLSSARPFTVYDDESPYTVTFDLDDKGTLNSGELVQSVEWGNAAVAPILVPHDGWYFTGWDVDFSDIVGNLTVTAQYVPTYTVTFDLGAYGTLLSGDLVQTIGEGFPATPPTFSVTSGWTFLGWDRSFSQVKSTQTVTAQYVPSHLVGALEEAKLTANDGASYDRFSKSVCVSRNTAIIGAFGDDDDGNSSGSAYVFVRRRDAWTQHYAWTQQAKLTASDGVSGDDFGCSVSVDGDTALIGAYGDDDDGSSSGSAYVFVRQNGVWSEQMKLTASDGVSGDDFGCSVSVDGDTALIGAFRDDDDGSSSGSAYVFVRQNGVWSEQMKLTASDGAAEDRFGYSVSLSRDTALIGAYGDDDDGSSSGSAYVFVRQNGVWSEQMKLTASDGAAEDLFGRSVSVNIDTALIGAYGDADNGSSSGSAYVFVRQNGVWSEQTKLTASDGAVDDQFGYSVNVSGHTALIGAYGDADNGSSSGSAYVFVRQNGFWREQTKLTASDGAVDDQFGYSVSVSDDMALIGAYGDNDNGSRSGSAFVFELGIPPATVTFDMAGKASRTGGGELTQQVIARHAAVVPIFLVSTGWQFTGWDVDFTYITEDLKVTAQYVELHTITFDLSVQGSLIEGELIQVIGEGYSATPPMFAVASGWHFTGWDMDFSNITGDLTVTAQYVPTYSVTFDLGEYGTLLAGDLVQTIGEGFSAIPPEFSVSSGWAFIGWDHSFNDVLSTLTVTAQYVPSNLVSVLEQAKLTASDDVTFHRFSTSVSLDGDTALIGAYGDNDNGFNSGSAYVFVRQNGVWSEQTKLTASDGAPEDLFGYSVSVSGDTALIGAQEDDDNGTASGSAYVFVRQNGVWSEQMKLTAIDGAAVDRFGHSVSLSGNTALIGAYRDDDSGDDSGSAYVFVRQNGVWSEQTKLTASDGVADDRFGHSVSLSGNTALIGAYLDDDNGTASGSAYVFVRQNGVWSEQTKLTASDGAAEDLFGYSVSVSGDTALIGAYLDDDNGASSGSAYVFVRQNGVWSEQTKLTASDGVVDDKFGHSVSLSGNTALIGAYGDDDSGSAYVFVRQNGAWSEQTKLTASDGVVDDQFGYSVSVSGDTALIGAHLDDDNVSNCGSVYVFDLGVPPTTVTFDLAGKASRTGGGALSQIVIVNTNAVAPEIIANTGWLFDGWDKAFDSVTADLTIVGLFSYDSTDRDSDNMMDGWEIVHLGSIDVSDGSIDSDLDGEIDYEEFISGHDPRDPGDRFEITDLQFSPQIGRISLRIPTNDDIANRRYRVLYSPDLMPGSWVEVPGALTTPSSGDYTDVSFEVPGDGHNYFIRVEAFLE